VSPLSSLATAVSKSNSNLVICWVNESKEVALEVIVSSKVPIVELAVSNSCTSSSWAMLKSLWSRIACSKSDCKLEFIILLVENSESAVFTASSPNDNSDILVT